MKLLNFFSFLIFVILLSACTSVRKDYLDAKPGYASKPSDHGTFAELEYTFAKEHGSQKSGFMLLEKSDRL